MKSYLNYLNAQNSEDSLIFDTAQPNYYKNITMKKVSLIKEIRLDINQSNRNLLYFQLFKSYVEKLSNIERFDITIDISIKNNDFSIIRHPRPNTSKQTKKENDDYFRQQKETKNVRKKEIMDYFVNVIVQRFKNTITSIRISDILIYKEDQTEQEKATKHYLKQLLQPLVNLREISFRQHFQDVNPSNIWVLKSVFSLLKEDSLVLPNLQMLDLDFRIEKNINKTPQIDILSKMVRIANLIPKIKSLSELQEFQIGIENLQLDSKFFEALFRSMRNMKKLKRVGLDISQNNVIFDDSIGNLRNISELSGQLESLIYIDSQQLKRRGMKNFSKTIKMFTNLHYLQIEKISFNKDQVCEFFSFVHYMPFLEDIRVDLSGCNLDDSSYEMFCEKLMEIKKLKSLYLYLPKQGQLMTSYQIHSIVNLLKRVEAQIENLSLVFSSDIDFSNQIKLRDTISNLKCLKMINIEYQINNAIVDSFCIDSSLEKSQNIFELKQFKCFQEYECNKKQIDLTTLLNTRLLMLQDVELLQGITYYAFEKHNSPKVEKEIQNEMAGINRFINIQNFQFNSDIIKDNYISKIQGVTLNNISTLQIIQINTRFTISFDNIMKILLPCINLQLISFQIEQVIYKDVQHILKYFPLLQEIRVLSKSSRAINDIIPFDYSLLLKPKYLLVFECRINNSCYRNFLNCIKDKQICILQLLAYSQLIKPFIIYKASQSHWDLSIN